MHPYLFYAVLTVVLLAMLACLVIMTVGVGKILSDLIGDLRQYRVRPGPREEQLTGRAASAVDRIARQAGTPSAPVVVRPLLGRPFPGGQHRAVGTGGLAVTRFIPGRPVTVEFAAAALTDLSDAALDSLVAHELAHVIRYRTRSGRLRHYAWPAAFLVASLPLVVWVAATQSGAALALTGVGSLAYLLLRTFWQRREELAADRFAIELTQDLPAAAELMGFYEQHMDMPLPAGRVRRTAATLSRRGLATHPEPQHRLEAMRGHLTSFS